MARVEYRSNGMNHGEMTIDGKAVPNITRVDFCQALNDSPSFTVECLARSGFELLVLDAEVEIGIYAVPGCDVVCVSNSEHQRVYRAVATGTPQRPTLPAYFSGMYAIDVAVTAFWLIMPIVLAWYWFPVAIAFATLYLLWRSGLIGWHNRSE